MLAARVAAVAIATLMLAGACIIPDSGIVVQGQFENPGTVRIVEAVAMSPEADDACADVSVELAGCPLPPLTLPFGLVGADASLCVCPAGDDNRLGFVDIYVEDPDVDDNGEPTDPIYGALLLDLPDDADDPSRFVAYENFLSPFDPAVRFTGGGAVGGYADSIARPTPQLRSWTLGRELGVDLCNDNAASKLSVGLHSLRLVVTDRPWYRPVVRDADGKVMLNDRDEPQRAPDDEALPGVVDGPAGASYAIADYVFRCDDGNMPDPGCACTPEGG